MMLGIIMRSARKETFMKRITTLFCTAALSLCSTAAYFPANIAAYAAENPDYPGIQYEVYSDSVTITKTWSELPENAVIPAEIDGKPVTCIAPKAFRGRDVKSISIPESVTFIGDHAFAECHSLDTAELPKNLTAISSGLFQSCESLKAVKIPDKVTSIGDEAFSNCIALSEITIPEGVTEIGTYALHGTAWLAAQIETDPFVVVNHILIDGSGCQGDITIPEGVTKICSRAFRNVTGLTGVTIPEGVTEIGTYAFWKCADLKRVDLPESLEQIDSYAFYMCTTLSDLEIPANVKNIGSYAFMNTRWISAQRKKDPLVIVNQIVVDGIACKDAVEIPEGVTAVSGMAFSKNTLITGITLPESVTSIGESAFFNCSALAEITVPETVTEIGRSAFSGTEWLSAKQSENPLVTVGKMLIDGTAVSGTAEIPAGVTQICGSAFEGAKQVRDIIVPESVTSIGDYVFDCIGLHSVALPASVERIGDYYLYTMPGAGFKGKTGSYAEQYAKEYGIPFEQTAESGFLLGDYNENGKVESDDAQNVLNYYVKTLSGSNQALSERKQRICDVNTDGAVDVTDAQYILLYYVKNTVAKNPTTWEQLLAK